MSDHQQTSIAILIYTYMSINRQCPIYNHIKQIKAAKLHIWDASRVFIFCPSFISTNSSTNYFLLNCYKVSHDVPSLWPEKDDINPKVNVPGRAAEVGVWVTHLQGFYASIAVKLNTPFSLISLWSIYHPALFPSFNVDTLLLWSPAVPRSIPLLYWSSLPAPSSKQVDPSLTLHRRNSCALPSGII